MMNYQTKTKNNFKTILTITKLIVIAGTVLFITSRVWYLVKGPSLTFIKPLNGTVVPVGITLLQGSAPTATNIWISGISVPVDTKGVFTYDIYVPKGLTTVPITVQNRYGKKTSKELVVWGE